MSDDHHLWHKPLPDPEGGGGRSPKKFLRPCGPQFGLKIRGARNPPLQTL